MKLARRTPTTFDRTRSLPVVGAAAAGVLLVGAVLFVFLTRDSSAPVAKVAAVVEQVKSEVVAPTPPPAATPTATPTRTPGPVPAAPVAPGRSQGLTNPSSLGFPAPAPVARTSPPNAAGVVRMVSPDLGLDHYIDTLGIEGGQMQSPDADGIHAVGWYPPDERYPLGTPGHEGNSVFSAHETWRHLQGPFYTLHKAVVGDDIYLDMADGTRRHYQVIRLTRYPAYTMPMGEVLWPSDRPAEQEWITLYTCGGRIVYDGSGYGDYLERDALVAVWVGNVPAS